MLGTGGIELDPAIVVDQQFFQGVRTLALCGTVVRCHSTTTLMLHREVVAWGAQAHDTVGAAQGD